MTRKEIEAEIARLQSQLETATDESEDTATAPPEKDGDTAAKVDSGDNEMNSDPEAANDEQEINSNDEVEEQKQIEPQTNGPITDDVPKTANQDEGSPALATAVVPGPKSVYENPTNAVEVVGAEQPVTFNYDEKFATIAKEYAVLAGAIDKLNVQMAQILTRIDLVQEVTDKVVTPDHDTFLTQAVSLLV